MYMHQMKQFSLLLTMVIIGWVIAACAGVETTPTFAPSETPALNPPAQAPAPVVPIPTMSPATAAPSQTSKPLPGPTATAAPLTLVPAPTPVYTQTPIDSEEKCVASALGASIRPVEEMVNGQVSGSAPNTYALKVRVETTSLWTSIEVAGVESMTSNHAITQAMARLTSL